MNCKCIPCAIPRQRLFREYHRERKFLARDMKHQSPEAPAVAASDKKDRLLEHAEKMKDVYHLVKDYKMEDMLTEDKVATQWTFP